MQRSPEWQIQRSGVPHLDGARRWDAAYQLLLTWAQAPHTARQVLPASQQQEEQDADRILHAGVDHPPTAGPDD
jgi:hypothetical protein